MRKLVIAGLVAAVGAPSLAACEDTTELTGTGGSASMPEGGDSNRGGDSGRGGQAIGGSSGASELAGAGGASVDGGAEPDGGHAGADASAGEGGSGGEIGSGLSGAGSVGDAGGANEGGSGIGGASGATPGGNGGAEGSDDPCGDGTLDVGEACDDGDDDPDDGCTACEVDFAHTCDKASPSQCTAPPSLGTLSTGAAIMESTEHAVAQGTELIYSIDFSSAVEVELSLDSFDGDPDLYVYDRVGAVIGVSEDLGPEVRFTLVLQPGRYYLGLVAYRALSQGFDIWVETKTP